MILQGTMQDGTVIPVQVDAQGRLVAEGLPGPAGPAGPQGEPGLQGPAGPEGGMTPPPGASDGDVLGWLNGQLVWMQVAVGGPVLTDVITAVTTTTGPVYSTSTSVSGPSEVPKTYLFDGDLETSWRAGASSPTMGDTTSCTSLNFNPPVTGINKLELYANALSTDGTQVIPNGCLSVNGVAVGASLGWSPQWIEIPGVATLNSITSCFTAGPYNGSYVVLRMVSQIRAIRVNGRLLVDNDSLVSLRFPTAKGLTDLEGGDAVYQYSGGPASGTVFSVDHINRELTIRGTVGAWGPAGEGHRVATPGTRAAHRR